MDFHANNIDLDVFVSNLPYRFEDRDLFDLALAHGKALQVRIALDRATGQSRGFGFVRFATSEDAQRAIASLDGLVIGGRVLKAKPLMRRPAPSGKETRNGQTR